MVHGCRQLVPGGVGLSPATSATPAACCQHSVGHSRGTAGVKPEEGGDDVKSSCPSCPGPHTCYNGRHNGLPPREGERIPKAGPSSDRRLQPACVKPELLVIADQHAAVNTFPGLVHTARHTTRVVCTRSRRPNPERGRRRRRCGG